MIPKGKYIRNTNAVSISNRNIVFYQINLFLKKYAMAKYF